MIFSYLDFKSVDLSGDPVEIGDLSAALELQSKVPYCVNFLPSHPFDHPFFGLVEKLLRRKPELFADILKQYQVPSVQFLFPVKNTLWQILQPYSSEGCSFRWVTPFYPFELTKIRGIDPAPERVVLGWFDFYRLLLHFAGEQLPGIPVSIVDLRAGSRSACLAPLNIKLEKLLEKAGFEALNDHSVCFDHPFMGTLLPKETPLFEIRPYSIIIVEKDMVERASFFHNLRRMISQKNRFPRKPLYDSSPTAVSSPCQKCLRCVRVCPDKIVPFVISALYLNENIKEAKKFLPELCRECGLCSYVCPSRIPLLHNIRGLKKETGLAV